MAHYSCSRGCTNQEGVLVEEGDLTEGVRYFRNILTREAFQPKSINLELGCRIGTTPLLEIKVHQ